MCIVVDICDTLLHYRHFFHFPPGWSANKRVGKVTRLSYPIQSLVITVISKTKTVLISGSVMSRGPVCRVIHHSPRPTRWHTSRHSKGPQPTEPKIIAGVQFYLSAPTFCGHPSPTATFSSSGALRRCFPLLTTCHVTAFTLFFTRRAPSQARRVTVAICTSCFHCLFNTASPLRLSHPLHAPPINRLPPRQQRVCTVGPSSSLHQRQAVVSV